MSDRPIDSEAGDGAPIVYTIGHSNHPWEVFVGLLRRWGVAVVADVRSKPYSRRFPQFRKDALAESLAAEGVGYRFLGRELGGRPDDPACYVTGAVDYSRVAALPTFQEGLARVAAEAAQGPLALMCAEKEPLDCHRALLIAPWLQRRGLSVQHILGDGGLEAHGATETRLLRLTGVDGDLFAEGASRAALLEEARRLRARRLARPGGRTPGAEHEARKEKEQ